MLTMSQNDIRTQRQHEQDERRLSLIRNNAFLICLPETNANVDQPRSITHKLIRKTYLLK